jgi:hypothetical protein
VAGVIYRALELVLPGHRATARSWLVNAASSAEKDNTAAGELASPSGAPAAVTTSNHDPRACAQETAMSRTYDKPIPFAAKAEWLPVLEEDVLLPLWEATHRRRAERAAREESTGLAPTAPLQDGQWPTAASDEESAVAILEIDIPPLDLVGFARLRERHVALVTAWMRARGRLMEARERGAADKAAARAAMRQAVMEGRDSASVSGPAHSEFAEVELEVLAETELAARRALGEFVVWAVERELPAYWGVLRWVDRLRLFRSYEVEVPSAAQAMSRAVGPVVYAIDQPGVQLPAVRDWMKAAA